MATMTKTVDPAADSLLDKLDELVPAPLAQFDAFPKLPASYKSRSESRGFLTIFVAFVAFLLIANDLGEYIWGWPDYEFGVDLDASPTIDINVDMVVNMPCQYVSVDLRDAVGDRLYLSDGFTRDGTTFDIGQATTLKEHAEALSARQAVAQSRRSRGLFDVLLWRTASAFKPTYNHKPDASACRVYGTITAKKVTANLHVTTAGHGYASHQHVDHKLMNLSHVITEFSFGPYFPDITQPLDNSFEITQDPFVAYQYFLHVVPTTYIAPRSKPLNTHQYSVTHYTRVLGHHQGTPGIFFKFDLDPLKLTIHQRTTSFIELVVRCVGVVGGVFVCMGYAVKITSHAVEAVTGADKSSGIVAAEASGVGSLRKRLGGDLRLRPGGSARDRVVRHGSGWMVEGGSPYGSYAGTPVTPAFSAGSPFTPHTPSFTPGPPPSAGPYTPSAMPSAPTPRSASYTHGQQGLGIASPRPTSMLSPHSSTSAIPTAATLGSPYAGAPGSLPGTPGLYANFPPTPNPVSAGPAAGGGVFAAQQAGAPPRSNGLRSASLNGSAGLPNGKKDD
ncbi:endoplasmic reticulum vesicle transporter-domain-containing protein [Epithele typhae]|uniref:endoplasmic reticulum vesicle transporter-domain-containing protein n=1 Tax=Epithele typhae TaxID=378194 RepID=UPI0020087CD6|nr:endoplasmic reticulum vesicle transporter-domain-containing protein [Epithele typhae]KAH9918929.1 endoplasmic reticulum vesicle transporter-domain-containing protein [Epithele typhae]